MNDQEPKLPKPRKERKKKPTKLRKDGTPYANPWAMKTPEQIARWKENVKRGLAGKQGRPAGLPDGIGLKRFLIHKAQVEAETKVIMEKLVKENDLDTADDKYAIEALETAVNIMRMQGDARNKLGAAKLVLEYTKAKPSTKSEVTINTAEALLEDILRDEQD
jgi:hypothetical protein